MNMFQIHDKDGKAININTLDQEACDLWDTQVDNKPKGSYASPYDKPEVKEKYMRGDHKFNGIGGEVAFWAQRENWFDTIGWKIAQGKTSWKGLRDEFLEIYRKYNIPEEDLKKDARIWGFVELIDLWESKGYIPVSMDGDYNILSKNGIRTALPEDATPGDEEQVELDTLHAAHSADMDHIRS